MKWGVEPVLMGQTRCWSSGTRVLQAAQGALVTHHDWHHGLLVSVRTEAAASRYDIVPGWPLFDQHGQVPSPGRDGVCRDTGWSKIIPTYWHPSGATGYQNIVASIPNDLRQLVANAVRFQWLILEMIRKVDGFRKFYQDECQATGNAHFVYAALSLAEAWTLGKSDRMRLSRRILHGKRHSVLSELSGKDWTRSCAGLLRRIEGHPLPDHNYAALPDLMASAKRRAILRHRSSISRHLLRRLPTVPTKYLSPYLAENLSHPALATSYTFSDCLLYANAIGPSAIQQLLNRIRCARSPKHLAALLSKSWEEHRSRLRFPEPPVAGLGKTTALETAAALDAEEDALGLSLGDLVPDILAGLCYAYRWHGRHAAIVDLRRRWNSWEIHEISGRGHHEIPQKEQREIRNFFAEIVA